MYNSTVHFYFVSLLFRFQIMSRADRYLRDDKYFKTTQQGTVLWEIKNSGIVYSKDAKIGNNVGSAMYEEKIV